MSGRAVRSWKQLPCCSSTLEGSPPKILSTEHESPFCPSKGECRHPTASSKTGSFCTSAPNTWVLPQPPQSFREETFVLFSDYREHILQCPILLCSHALMACFALSHLCCEVPVTVTINPFFVDQFAFLTSNNCLFLYLMFWVALKLNGVLWALCSALQSSSCVSSALTNDLSHPDTKTGHSCFPRSFK